MNTMLSSATELEARVRNHVYAMMAANMPDMLFAFDLAEGLDASPNKAGALFDQNNNFALFELNIENGRRAGPGWVSPRRYWGVLDLAFVMKGPRDKVRYTGMVETFANWFQDQTINGIRFRTYIPTPPVHLRGFTSYNGVINFEFEISLTR